MIKQRIYIDTSVVGGCFDDEFKEWSRKLFVEFMKGSKIAVISDIMIDELRLAREEIRNLVEIIPLKHKEYIGKDKEIEKLAAKYINEGAISKKFHEDALHIAIATIYKVDVLVSWNFKHLVNIERIRKYNAVNLKNGYSMVEIRTPREILGE